MPDEPDPSFTDLTVAISMPGEGWLKVLPEADRICRTAARAAYSGAAESQDIATEISIVLADDPMVRELNRDYRNQDKPTNVLSFPLGDEGVTPDGGMRMLGDVILSFETTAGEAAQQAKSLSAHTSHLVVHGVLHLIGFDHEEDGDAEEMETLERQILASLNIADPYLVGTIS
jgi:probable rRNA maturation factor